MKSKVGRKIASNASILHPNDHAHSHNDECFSSGIKKERLAARNVSGFLIRIQQTEFYSHVWKRILDDTNVRSGIHHWTCNNQCGAFTLDFTSGRYKEKLECLHCRVHQEFAKERGASGEHYVSFEACHG